MTKRKKIDMNFRPDSYWDEDALLANVKGEFRRRQILQAINDGEVDEIPPPILADSLPEHLRDFTGSIHPMLMGGEYLPDYENSEVEIARVALDSTTCDVISVRARPETNQTLRRVSRRSGGTRYRRRTKRPRQTVIPAASTLPLPTTVGTPDLQLRKLQ